MRQHDTTRHETHHWYPSVAFQSQPLSFWTHLRPPFTHLFTPFRVTNIFYPPSTWPSLISLSLSLSTFRPWILSWFLWRTFNTIPTHHRHLVSLTTYISSHTSLHPHLHIVSFHQPCRRYPRTRITSTILLSYNCQYIRVCIPNLSNVNWKA